MTGKKKDLTLKSESHGQGEYMRLLLGILNATRIRDTFFKLKILRNETVLHGAQRNCGTLCHKIMWWPNIQKGTQQRIKQIL